MKLQCQVDVVNRLQSNLNLRSNGKYLKSTLALGKEPRDEKDYFILHFSSVNKTGIKYKVKCMKRVFVKCLSEGKATIRFEEPPHDLCIKSEVIQLKCFMKLLAQCVNGDTKALQLSSLSNISVTAKDNAPTKLIIKDRSEFPSKGFPRTLESLSLAGLNLYNFRREVLLLRHLTILDLRDNQIEKIPPEFGRMPSLNEVYLANNKLGAKGDVDWRWMLDLQITKSLKLLDLSGNELNNLPKAIWKLQKLITLGLNNNCLEMLPSTLGRIGSLRYLFVQHNKLHSLPGSLMQCHLQHLDISSNTFHNIPSIIQNKHHSIGSLVHLASKVVLKTKRFYASNIIPYTLVEFLDNANICMCGDPVINDTYFKNKQYVLKDYFPTVVFDNNQSMVNFECYFCSPKCFRK